MAKFQGYRIKVGREGAANLRTLLMDGGYPECCRDFDYLGDGLISTASCRTKGAIVVALQAQGHSPVVKEVRHKVGKKGK